MWQNGHFVPGCPQIPTVKAVNKRWHWWVRLAQKIWQSTCCQKACGRKRETADYFWQMWHFEILSMKLLTLKICFFINLWVISRKCDNLRVYFMNHCTFSNIVFIWRALIWVQGTLSKTLTPLKINAMTDWWLTDDDQLYEKNKC